MENNYFTFNGRQYYTGTIIRVKKDKLKDCDFCSRLVFIRYDDNNNMYHFNLLGNIWKVCKIPKQECHYYIDDIVNAKLSPEVARQKLNPKYIDGIVSAWIWYILIMFFALFIKGAHNTITLWIATTCIFFNWRKKKINGE